MMFCHCLETELELLTICYCLETRPEVDLRTACSTFVTEPVEESMTTLHHLETKTKENLWSVIVL